MKIGQSKELKGYQKEYFNENDPDWRETSLNYRVTDLELSQNIVLLQAFGLTRTLRLCMPWPPGSHSFVR